MSTSLSSSSPHSYLDYPDSSPGQQVPHLTNFLTHLQCIDGSYCETEKPFLRIQEQPHGHFRFRYKSEMVGTHGCILGKTSNKLKTYPSVELINYCNIATIRCKLVQVDNEEDHPHKLLEDEQDKDVSCDVGPKSGYKARFPGMGIIHTAKKDVPQILYQKEIVRNIHNSNFNEKQLRSKCDLIAKNINLNIVRLRFSAHDPNTGQEICDPVYSEPIHNMKSAATNDLKICRMSRITGQVRGGDEIYLLIEKVNKNNIDVRLVEVNNNGDVCWMERCAFSQNDVHHQYAIIVRTPPYKDQDITSDVTVFIELYRPKDNKTSQRLPFTYAADKTHSGKKRKICTQNNRNYNNYHNNIDIKELPTPVQSQSNKHTNEQIIELEDAFLSDIIKNKTAPTQNQISEIFEQIHLPELPFEWKYQENQTPSEELKSFLNEAELDDYLDSLINEGGFNELMADSGQKKKHVKTKHRIEKSTDIDNSIEYKAYYEQEDAKQVKKLMKTLSAYLKNRKEVKISQISETLEQLMNIRLSNGDTFLHMVLCSNMVKTIENLIELICLVKPDLLNSQNDDRQTLLHYAVIYNMEFYIFYLISKGCDPMLQDKDGNNAIHLSIIHDCLQSVLIAVKRYGIVCNLDCYNNEMNTPLHMASLYDSSATVKLLLDQSCDSSLKDKDGRTSIHLAVYGDSLDAVRVLVGCMDKESINIKDSHGFTALQILCGGQMRKNTIEIFKLLLENGADPYQSANNKTALDLVTNKPELSTILNQYIKSKEINEQSLISGSHFEISDISKPQKSNPQTFSSYIDGLSQILDSSGNWRLLAEKTECDSLIIWYERTESPSRTLLNEIQDCHPDMTAMQLAEILQDIGEIQAASFITEHIV